MSLFTLRKMADGGLHDHLGGGFHRYSVDTFWHVPHFEKMLYDQAQLAGAYLDAYQITHDPVYAGVARDTLDYVRRDMTGKEGEFYSAEDADSPVPSNPADHAEGAFYVWEQQEIVAALGKETAAVVDYHYGVESNGNAPDDPQGEFRHKNILSVRHTVAETAYEFGQTDDEVRDLLDNARLELRAVRALRPRPHLDDKTLTAWNGLTISAFARAAQVLDEPRYLAAAQQAAAFIDSRLSDKSTGALRRRYRAGETAVAGFVDDYAYLIQGLLDLYEASFDVKWLTWAIDLQKKQDELFWDKDSGGYFSTPGNDPSVLWRAKEDYDGAEPAPNSVAALNLLRLSQMAGHPEFRAQAERVFAAFASRLRQAPSALPQMLVAYDFSLDKPLQIVIAGQPEAPDTQALLRQVHDRFIPSRILLLADGASGQETLAQRLEFIRDVKPLDGKATAYVCENFTCQLPTADPAELGRQLDALRTQSRPPPAEPSVRPAPADPAPTKPSANDLKER